jgi:hypothetical protein
MPVQRYTIILLGWEVLVHEVETTQTRYDNLTGKPYQMQCKQGAIIVLDDKQLESWDGLDYDQKDFVIAFNKKCAFPGELKLYQANDAFYYGVVIMKIPQNIDNGIPLNLRNDVRVDWMKKKLDLAEPCRYIIHHTS